MLCHRFGLQTGVEFRVPLFGEIAVPGLLLGPKVQEDLADHFPRLNALHPVGINLGQGLGHGFIRGGQAQAISGPRSSRRVDRQRAGFSGRLLRLLPLPGLADSLRIRLKSTGWPSLPMPVCRISRHFRCDSRSKTGRLQDSWRTGLGKTPLRIRAWNRDFDRPHFGHLHAPKQTPFGTVVGLT